MTSSRFVAIVTCAQTQVAEAEDDDDEEVIDIAPGQLSEWPRHFEKKLFASACLKHLSKLQMGRAWVGERNKQ